MRSRTSTVGFSVLAWGLCTFVSLSLSALVSGAPALQVGNTKLTDASLPDLQQDLFGGIPYAEPPVGSLRFLHRFSSSIQESLTSLPPNLVLPVVRAPNIAASLRGVNSSSLLPVIVWVHDGGFSQGSASMYNGSVIAVQSIGWGTPVVYANPNYRLGSLAFPQDEEAETLGETNFGNKVVIAALIWIKQNIDTFDGRDEDKITIFREIWLGGKPTISQSPGPEDIWKTFASFVPECEGASCNNTFDCLRSASSDTILNAATSTLTSVQERTPFSPVIDSLDGIIPDLPSKLSANSQFEHIPFIAGTNLDEGTTFVPTAINSTAQFQQAVFSAASPSLVSSEEQASVINTALQMYPDDPASGSPFGTGNETFGLSSQLKRATAILCDVSFTSPRRSISQKASEQGVKVFAYLFTVPQAANLPAFVGVEHGSDKAYVGGAP
ncbi:hypothetical protein ACEPAH_93 [Sanghuangporus vaninii]